MSAVFASPAVPSVLPPQVAGTQYPAGHGDLTELLGRSLVTARSSSIEHAKMVIAPLALNETGGVVMASAFANLANRRGIVKKVVVVGPARQNLLRGIAIPSHAAFSTPLGRVALDPWNLRLLRGMAEVSVDDRGFEKEGAIETVLPLLQACLERFELTPVLVGNVPPAVVAQALQKVWGGAETLIVLTSNLSGHLEPERARAFDVETRGLIETLAADQIGTTRADGHRIIAGGLIRAQQLDLRVTGLDFRTAPAGNGKVTGYGAFAFEPAQTAHLNSAERRHLLKFAAQTILAVAENPLAPARPLTTQRTPMTLSALRATTVSIERDGVLRGMAGGLKPFRPLMADIVARAAEAAAGDARFAPIVPDELAKLTVSISIASTPRAIPAESEIAAIAALMPGRDGLVIDERGRTAWALPEEWNRIPHPALFIRTLKQRAGLSSTFWSEAISLKRFTAETFSAPLASLIE
jgi:AmmeMemoRadiSam system protein A/AmmeMemoRadiSam system protein B